MRIMILLLFAVFRLQATAKAQDDDFSAPFTGSMCGVGSIRHEPLHPDLMVVEEPKTAFMAAQSQEYKPYRMLFVYDQGISPATKRLIEKAAESSNARLGRAVKSPVLTDVRLPQVYNKTSKSCQRPKCQNYVDKLIPYQYVQPCRDPNGKIIVTDEDKSTEKPSIEIAKLTSEGYSVTVFVYIHGEGTSISTCPTVTFEAVADYCREDSTSNRPTHGIVFWCKPPSAMSDTEAGHLMLHELLHVVTAVNLIGIGAPRSGCVRDDSVNRDDNTHESVFPEKCKKKTWDTMEIPRMVNNVKTTPFTAYLSLTPHVQKAVREHFNCPTLAGAELLWEYNGTDVYTPSSKHWSYRLFSDDILSKYIHPRSRLTVLTLAAIKDTNWYEVDLSKAEPLMYSRPKKEDGCKMATEHCDKILDDTRAKKRPVNFIAPYCNDTNPKEILSPLCSKDGTMMLSCENTVHTNDCPVIIGIVNYNAQKYNYDTMVCEEAIAQPKTITGIGGQVGPGTMCAVFASIPQWPDKARKNQMRFCVKRKCQADAVVLYLTPPGASCEFACKKTTSNQVIDFQQKSVECKKALGDQVSLICPDFDAVCTSKTTIPTPKPSTPILIKPYNPYKSCHVSSGPTYQDENDYVPESYVAPDPNSFVPYKISFLYDGRTSNKSLVILANEHRLLNKYLATFLKAPRLHEIRRARKWNDTIGKCNPATCRGLKIPSSRYVLPCFNKAKQLHPEDNIKVDPTLEVKKYNAANYTLVVYVYVHEESGNFSQCHEQSTLYFGASASAAFCQVDPVTRRPTHAALIWCHKPSDITDAKLTFTFQHEALHIITGGSFIASGVPALKCTDPTESFPTRCEGKTFKFVNQSWADEKGVITNRTTCIAITPQVKKAAQDHFNCPTVEGAEVDVVDDGKGSVCVDQRYWNMRLFSDELMTPHQGAKHLSALTFAALKDTEWYQVNMSQAYPLVISRPRGLESCHVATKSCHEILNNSRRSDTKLAKPIEPYCDNEHKIISSRCTTDGKIMLSCGLDATGDCHILLVDIEEPEKLGYDSIECAYATKQSANAVIMGGNIGKDTMCATATVDPNLPKKVQPMCVLYECRKDAVLLVLTLKNGMCQYSCTRDKAYKLITPDQTDACKQAQTVKIHLLCPDFVKVCSFLQTTTKIVPPSPAGVTSKPSGPATTKGDDPHREPTPGKPGSPGIKHDSKYIALTLFVGVVLAKVWFQIY